MVKLQSAYLCAECDYVFRPDGKQCLCPHCGSASVLNLARILNRDSLPYGLPTPLFVVVTNPDNQAENYRVYVTPDMVTRNRGITYITFESEI